MHSNLISTAVCAMTGLPFGKKPFVQRMRVDQVRAETRNWL
jgi:hypothetical protein